MRIFFEILIFQLEYIEMCFYGNQRPLPIKHPLISLHFKYYFLNSIAFLTWVPPYFQFLTTSTVRAHELCPCISPAMPSPISSVHRSNDFVYKIHFEKSKSGHCKNSHWIREGWIHSGRWLGKRRKTHCLEKILFKSSVTITCRDESELIIMD